MMKRMLLILAMTLTTVHASEDEIAQEIRDRILPAVADNKISKDVAENFFYEKVYPLLRPRHTPNPQQTEISDNLAFLRMAADSLGGGSLGYSEIDRTRLLGFLQSPQDLEVVKNVISKPTEESYNTYGRFMYENGLWPSEFLSEAVRTQLGLNA